MLKIGENVCWMCESQGYYRNVRCGAAAFSADGSLLAVAFDSTLTLWNPDTNELRKSVSFDGHIRLVQKKV